MDLRIEKFRSSAHSLGLLCEFVSRHPPFDSYNFGHLVRTILYQLDNQTHLVGLQEHGIVAYLGWVRTTSEIAEDWLERDSPLETSNVNVDAVAVTILALSDPKYSLPLIRKAKTLEPGRSVYWKRNFITGKDSVKRVVRTKK